MNSAVWTVDQTKILTREELAAVLANLKRKARRSVNTRQNLIIFRLACCCGLRNSEIAGLTMSNVKVGISHPYIYIPKSIGKGGKARRVPLWWDRGTLADLEAWKAERTEQGATGKDYYVCSQAENAFGRKLDRHNVRYRFIASCNVLGSDRQSTLTIHHGRHSFISHALAGGRSLAEVKQAAGHVNIATTSVYTHITVDDGQMGNLFAFEKD